MELSETQKRGRGTWKFNNNLLNDKHYIDLIKQTISNVIQEAKFENKNVLWEYLKCQIRTDTMVYASQKAKIKRAKEIELENRLENLEQNLQNNENNFLKYQLLKNEWEDIQRERTNGIMVRSKAKWVEYGEKNSKYFLNLEKQNYNIKYIKKIIKPDGTEIHNPNQIIDEQVNFYSDLYRSKKDTHVDENLLDTFLTNNSNIPKLEDPDKNSCENQITIDDLTEALRYMSLDKSPGADGFTTNFYKSFWHELKQPLLDSFLFSFETGELADGQRRGLLNLIPKKDKDLRYLKSWRPVSLLATDYKILAKALAIRLQKVISGLVNSDQVGYIK